VVVVSVFLFIGVLLEFEIGPRVLIGDCSGSCNDRSDSLRVGDVIIIRVAAGAVADKHRHFQLREGRQKRY